MLDSISSSFASHHTNGANAAKKKKEIGPEDGAAYMAGITNRTSVFDVSNMVNPEALKTNSIFA